MDGPPVNDCCSICHGRFKTPCQANCSHWFCGDCIMLVWHHGSAFLPCKCPLCRRQITLLVPGEASLRERNDPEVAEILAKIERYNHLFGGTSSSLFQVNVSCNRVISCLQRVQDLPFLLRRLLREMMDPQRTLPFVIRARVYLAVKCLGDCCESCPALKSFCTISYMQMILSAVYIVSPVDIIPEAILGIVGLLDDFLIILICFLHVAAIYRSVLYYRHGGS
ncbi:hypothetical protein Tsubulata_015526 [Turnera subulata]|uniref:E3 ubiquitin-protein ligase RNF170 n=1 Tax=Turnera subulata TaxID=218843 RepID=A0A9Q0F3N0_9ROSI|nr:hypothetical protein Tsubulata_015526 [Turnera subulata]